MLLACQLCGRACSSQLGCPSCQALFYCSSKHCRMHAANGHDPQECSRMQLQLQRSPVRRISWGTACMAKYRSVSPCPPIQQDLELAGFPWWKALTETFEQLPGGEGQPTDSMCSILSSMGCHRKGIWRHICPCLQLADAEHMHLRHDDSSHCSDCLPDLDSQLKEGLLWFLEPAVLQPSLLPRCSIAADPAALPQTASSTGPVAGHLQGADSSVWIAPLCWEQYYRQRGLPSESPVALALHFVLSLLLGVATALQLPGSGLEYGQRQQQPEQEELEATADSPLAKRPKQVADVPARCPDPGISGSVVHVLYLGPRSELGMLPVFLELLPLLPPHVSLCLHFVGPDVPTAWHAREECMQAETTACTSAALNTDPDALGSDSWAGWLQQVAGSRGLKPALPLTQHASPLGACGDPSLASRALPPLPFGSSGPATTAGLPESKTLRFSFWQAALHEVHEDLVSR